MSCFCRRCRPRHRGYVKGLLGLHDRATAALLRDASIDAVFELIPLRTWYGVPALAWIPDFQHRRLPAFFSRRERFRRDLNYRARLRLHRHAMVSSQASLRDLQDFAPRPRAQVHVVPFAVKPAATEDAAIDDAIARHALPPVYFFLPNQFWQHKNHAVALQAVAIAAKRDPAITVVLSGQAVDPRAAGYPARLILLIQELNIASNVRQLGTIPHADLLALIAGARALINPSLFEGWSTTVEEAKAIGTPMILSALNVHREQAQGHAAFFPPQDADALAQAMLEAQQQQPLDRAARRAAAAVWSAGARQNYASRLLAALAATVADGFRLRPAGFRGRLPPWPRCRSADHPLLRPMRGCVLPPNAVGRRGVSRR